MKTDCDYDLIILGGGSAGVVAGVIAGSSGLRTLLIEKSRMGGECLNTGCVPSKALLEAADIAHKMRTADRFGLKSSAISREDAAGVLRYVRETILRVETADATTKLLEDSGVEIRFGDAGFVGRNEIDFTDRESDRRRLVAESFLIATGSHPQLPDIPGMEETAYLTNKTIFSLTYIPESLIVLGGGPVGVEMAQAFQRLGCAVTIVERNERILASDDREAARVVQDVLEKEGVSLRLSAVVQRVEARDASRIVHVLEKGEASEIEGAAILVATGRAPNVEGLNLPAAGVEASEKGIVVDETLRTTNPRIWACGDVTGQQLFSHMAEYEARLAVLNILFPFGSKTRAGYRIAPWTTFTDPELAHIGFTEEEAKELGIDYQVYRQPFAQNDRALTADSAIGFVKVIATGLQGKVIGAHIVGPRAGELIQEWIYAMTHGLSVRQVADTLHVYPTLSNTNQHAAYRWYEAQAEKRLVRGALHTYTRTIRPNLGRIAWGLSAGAFLTGGLMLRRSLLRKKSR